MNKFTVLVVAVLALTAFIIVLATLPRNVTLVLRNPSVKLDVSNSSVRAELMEYFSERGQKIARLTILLRCKNLTESWSGDLSVGVDPWGAAYIEEVMVSVSGETTESINWLHWVVARSLDCYVRVNRSDEGVYSIVFRDLGKYGSAPFTQWFRLDFEVWPLRLNIMVKVRVGSTIYRLVCNESLNPFNNVERPRSKLNVLVERINFEERRVHVRVSRELFAGRADLNKTVNLIVCQWKRFVGSIPFTRRIKAYSSSYSPRMGDLMALVARKEQIIAQSPYKSDVAGEI